MRRERGEDCRVRPICRRAPVSGRALTHARRRRRLWENGARGPEVAPRPAPGRGASALLAHAHSVALFTTAWRQPGRRPTVGQRLLQALGVLPRRRGTPSWGWRWAQARRSPGHTLRRRPPGRPAAGPRAQVGCASASKWPGSFAGCWTVRPTLAGRPKALSARSPSLASRPHTETKASQGPPQWRSGGLCPRPRSAPPWRAMEQRPAQAPPAVAWAQGACAVA